MARFREFHETHADQRNNFEGDAHHPRAQVTQVRAPSLTRTNLRKYLCAFSLESSSRYFPLASLSQYRNSSDLKLYRGQLQSSLLGRNGASIMHTLLVPDAECAVGRVSKLQSVQDASAGCG